MRPISDQERVIIAGMLISGAIVLGAAIAWLAGMR